MKELKATAGPSTFTGRLELDAAPTTRAAFVRSLPFVSQPVPVRRSGEGVWSPLGHRDFGVGHEDHTGHPGPARTLLIPGGIPETETPLAYGGVHLASKVRQLAGNHSHAIGSGTEKPYELGRTVLWKGAQDIQFEPA